MESMASGDHANRPGPQRGVAGGPGGRYSTVNVRAHMRPASVVHEAVAALHVSPGTRGPLLHVIALGARFRFSRAPAGGV